MMLSEVENLREDLFEMVPDIYNVTKDLERLSKKLQSVKGQEDRRVKRFMCERDFLQPYIKEIMADMTEMRQKIEEMLGKKVWNLPNEVPEQESDMTDHLDHDSWWSDHGPDEYGENNLLIPKNTSSMQPQAEYIHCDCTACKELEKSEQTLRKVCHVCGKDIVNGNAHMEQEHPDEKKFHCQECGGEFPDFESLWSHKLWHESEKQKQLKQCHICRKVFKSNTAMRRHVQNMHHKRSIVIKKRRHNDHGTIDNKVSKAKQTCTICFKSYTNYKLHRALRCSVKSYDCTDCNESFASSTLYHKHLQDHKVKNGKRFKCEICDRIFTTKIKRDTHMSLHTGTKFGCNICGKSYGSVTHLNVHKKRHKSSEFACSICTKVFKYSKSLEEHMNSHNGIKPFDCDKCDKQFATTISLYNHKLRMHSERYQGTTCKICGLKFKGEFARNTHYFKHSREELACHNIVLDEISCDICGKVMRKHYLKRHKLTKHGDTVKASFMCEICGKAFKHAHSLRLHILLHKREQMAHKITADEARDPSQDYPHLCEICNRAFSTKQNLKLHKYLHFDIKPYSCSVCNKCFREEAQLNFHKKCHTGDHPFKCHFCGKKFMYRHVLVKHINSHLNRRPFVCSTCGRAFNDDKNLKRHVLVVHMGERKFKCDFCEKSFSQKHIRDVHHNTHTGAKPHGCDICGQRFSDPSTLYKHKARHQKEKDWHEKAREVPFDNSAAIRDSLISVYDMQIM